MIRRPPRSTRTDTLFPYTTLVRSTARCRRPLLGRALFRDRGIGDEDLDRLFAIDPANEFIDISALARGEEGERRAREAVGYGQLDIAPHRFVDEREIDCGISSSDLRDRGELGFQQTYPREAPRRPRAFDMVASGRHHPLGYP